MGAICIADEAGLPDVGCGETGNSETRSRGLCQVQTRFRRLQWPHTSWTPSHRFRLSRTWRLDLDYGNDRDQIPSTARQTAYPVASLSRSIVRLGSGQVDRQSCRGSFFHSGSYKMALEPTALRAATRPLMSLLTSASNSSEQGIQHFQGRKVILNRYDMSCTT